MFTASVLQGLYPADLCLKKVFYTMVTGLNGIVAGTVAFCRKMVLTMRAVKTNEFLVMMMRNNGKGKHDQACKS